MWHLGDIVTGSGGMVPVEQKAKLDEAMALVGKTQVLLCCNVCMLKQAVPWNSYALCHCNARLADDVELMKCIMEAKANAVGHCLDILYRERQPDEQEPMQPAINDTCGSKARGKGTPLRVPQVGDENGPKWIKESTACGWKLWV